MNKADGRQYYNKRREGLKKAKHTILNHVRLESDFMLIFQRRQERDQRLETDHALSAEVYTDVIAKVCNVRFNKVVGNYSKKIALKGK